MSDIQTEEKWLSDLQETLLPEGAFKIGFADLTELPEEQRRGLPRGISIAVPVDLAVINSLGKGMTSEYHTEYNRTNSLLGKLARLTADFLQKLGYTAVAIIGDEVSESYQGHSSLLPHKTVATRAGMGWIGRNALLVTKELGSAIRITSVLTDAPLPCADPVNLSSCGECSMCVANCPGQAPLGPAWSVDSKREDLIDILSCRKSCVERSWRVAPGMSMCSLCVLVCPWTRRAIERSGLAYGFPVVEIAGKEDLEEILALQKLAFYDEAVRRNDFTIKPMSQTIDELEKEYSDPRQAEIFLKIVLDRRIVGSVRAYEKEGTCHIGRMIVHPDYKRRGYGSLLMKAIETCFKGARYELFTAAESAGNIRFYESLGYRIYQKREGPGNIMFVCLEKFQ